VKKDGHYCTGKRKTIVLLRLVEKILNSVKLAGKAPQKMYWFHEQRSHNILQDGLEMVRMLIANENSGIVRVAMVELWAELNVGLGINLVFINSPMRRSLIAATSDLGF